MNEMIWTNKSQLVAVVVEFLQWFAIPFLEESSREQAGSIINMEDVLWLGHSNNKIEWTS